MSSASLRARTFSRSLLLASAAWLAACTATREPTAPAPSRDVAAQVASLTGIVISQVYGGGGNSGATLTNDFIELHNAGVSPVDVTGWSVQYASATGTNWQVTPLTGTIAPGGYYLVQQGQGAGGTTPLPTPDATGTIAMSATAGKVALVNSTTSLTGSTGCPTVPSIQDFVGFGTTANCFEGTGPTPSTANATAAIRNGAGTVDTDNNAADFTIGAPTPRNGASAVPSVVSTVPGAGAADVALSSNLTVTFNRPVAVSGDWFTIACSNSGTRTATVSGGPTAWTLDPETDFGGSETCTATIIAAQVTAASDAALAMAADYSWSFTTISGNACTDAFTPAYTVQGSGATTPLAGQTVTTAGVVVGDYEGVAPALRGFYVQDAEGDGNPATSDAVFVFNANNDNVSIGDFVRVSGRAEEFQGQTQIGAVSAVTVCGSARSVAPVDVTLPVVDATDLERFEGMLVRLPQTLTVTEHFQLGRFGQIVMSSGDRLHQPTSIATPGAAALAVQAQNDLNRIIIDDASQGQNPDPILFGRGGSPLSASNTLRGGDRATGIVGVMTFTWAGNAASGNAYRVRPIGALGGAIPNFAASNARPAAPAAVGGTLKVAALNVLNYFNTFTGCTNGVGGASTDCRGADNDAEFERQAAKTVTAILGMNADIIGLIEMENDGYGPTSALADLVGRLNAGTAPGTYAFIDADAATGQVNALGTDAIKVALVYKPAKVMPTGTTAVLNSVAFVNGGDPAPRNRPSLAQAFMQPNRARVVIDVNHLKSKGSGCSTADAGDGQGECNVVRTVAANELKAWLATDPTQTGETDVMILGDLNAYAKEDPITSLTSGGYANLIESRIGQNAYSFVFDGQWGYLDHALASSSLVSQVTGVTEWHINADEPSVLDYNTNFKSAGQVTSLFAPDQYRVADHDPILVGLNLTAPVVFNFRGFFFPVANPPAVNRVVAGLVVPMRFTLGGNRGLDIFAPGYPASRPTTCDATAGESEITETRTFLDVPLQYVRLTDRYTYFWKTEREWRGSCREIVFRFRDGTEETAKFRFR
ncbi:MAG: ExeM/NucH family extracellular endonuclease [Gemmatimonadaceae bacterium]|nr:ExeM/NucH family extracellular endonuclease [Gemmatimonadaceae bacterium]